MSQNFHNRQTFSDENTLIIRKRNTVLCLANENILSKVLGGNRFELAPVKKWLGWQFKIYLHKFAAFCLASTMMIAWWKKIQCERERKRDLAIPNTNARNLNTKTCTFTAHEDEKNDDYMGKLLFEDLFTEHRADDEFSASVFPTWVHPWRPTTPPRRGEYRNTNTQWHNYTETQIHMAKNRVNKKHKLK